MDGAATSYRRAEAHLPTGSEDEDGDDLYGDVNIGFLAVLPFSPSPAQMSPPKTPSPGPTPPPSSPPPHRAPSPEPHPMDVPPKTPSPGLTLSPSPPLHRASAPEPRPLHEPGSRPKPSASQHHPPRPPPPTAPRHQMAQPQPRGDASSSSPSGPALYISELLWWTTDAEVEAALAVVPHAVPTLCDLFFFYDKYTGKSRGICRAEFLSSAVAAAAAATLQGRAFHGRRCVASLSRPLVLNRLGDDSNAEPVQTAWNPSRCRGSLGTGRGRGNATPIRGNVGSILGDRPAQAPPPQLWVAQRAHGLPFGGTMGSGGGYGGFQPLEQFNAGMGTGMMPPAVAPHMNPAFLAAGGIAVRGPGVWPDQAMDVGFWGAQPQWNFRGCQLPWHRPAPTMQAQQQHGEGEYGKIRGMKRGRPGRSDGMGIGNVRSHPERRQSDHDGGDLYKEHDREERSRHGERVPKKEREPERQWDDGDGCRGDKRRYQEYTDDDDNNDRREWARARSQSRNDVYDDHPRWRL